MTSQAQRDAPDQSAEEPAVNDEHPDVGRELQEQIADILGGNPEDYTPR